MNYKLRAAIAGTLALAALTVGGINSSLGPDAYKEPSAVASTLSPDAYKAPVAGGVANDRPVADLCPDAYKAPGAVASTLIPDAYKAPVADLCPDSPLKGLSIL